MSQPISGVACRSVWRFTSSERGTFIFLPPRKQLLAREVFKTKESQKYGHQSQLAHIKIRPLSLLQPVGLLTSEKLVYSGI
jgi:hypothetical protein